jgi:hypothetical protein
MKPFQPHVQGDSRRRSVAALIRAVIAIDDPSVLAKHKRDVLDCLLWKYTEADGKYNTRYRSHSAQMCPDELVRETLTHEHVFPKKKMISDLLEAGPNGVEAVLKNAIGCLVTKEEHKHLTAFDADFDGWDRYVKAGIQTHSEPCES